MNKKRATGWTTLWPWVIGVFVLLIAAWGWLIITASSNAPEPIEVRKVE